MIIAITGASGVGKTYILKEISKKSIQNLFVKYFHFDDIGMPNWDEIADSKKWQKETTIKWIDRLVKIARNENVNIVFEGSTEFEFFIQGFEKNNFFDYKLLLFNCSKETMQKRLIKRGQPDLYTPDMKNWLHYLRKEAILHDFEIINTDQSSIDEIGQIILNKLT